MAVPRNHTAVRFYTEQIQKLLQKEVKLNAAIGPFRESPFDRSYFSPLNSVPKKESSDRRLILDLSYPPGNSINDGIYKDWYLDEFYKLTLPSVDNLVERIMELGRSCQVFKVDLSRAYRQIFIDFSCVNLLGYVFNNELFYDCTLSMGSRSSARCCQRVSDCIVYIVTNDGNFAINYLDDIAGAEKAEKAQQAFLHLQRTLKNFGLKEALNKTVAPCTVMIFLGIEVNTVTLTISIPKEKWDEIMQLLSKWSEKQCASLKETQKLCGLLNFACRCVRAGRVYLSRILNFLRTLPKTGMLPIPTETKKDISWWLEFAPHYNCTSLMLENEWSKPDSILSTDSCLTGGGICTNSWFAHWQYPQEIVLKQLHINELECMMIVVALKLSGDEFARKKLVVFCDNFVTVRAINSGFSRNLVIQHCLRELHMVLALINGDIKAEFLRGIDNRESDALSRWHLDIYVCHKNRFQKLNQRKK